MKVAAVFPVGTSVGGTPDAIVEILKVESALDVYLIPGKPGSAMDAKDPRQFAKQIRESVYHPGINWVVCEAAEAYDLSETYRQIRDWVAELAGHDYERVYVGITGGTNPMNASLFQAAMAYLQSVVVPVYVQAHGANFQKSFAASEIRDRVIAEEALATARSGQIRLAASLAERLPRVEPWKFLRQSLNALSQWDDFNYGEASGSLEQQARKRGEYAGHDLLGSVAETIARIAANARRLCDFTKQLRDDQNFNRVAKEPGWADSVSEAGVLLAADALANANRRTIEGRYTDSVLRSYRAAECATQMRLLAIGIHPSRPDACPSAYERYAPQGRPGERPLAFDDGLKFLRSSSQFDLSPIEKKVRDLQNLRNRTYLEHGYVWVRQDQADRCFDWSLDICEALLGSPIREKWREFEMRL